jgi:hypothetical protein
LFSCGSNDVLPYSQLVDHFCRRTGVRGHRDSGGVFLFLFPEANYPGAPDREYTVSTPDGGTGGSFGSRSALKKKTKVHHSATEKTKIAGSPNIDYRMVDFFNQQSEIINHQFVLSVSLCWVLALFEIAPILPHADVNLKWN